MILIIVAIITTIFVFKLMDNSKVTQLALEIRNLKLRITAFKIICKKYEKEFGLKESLRILQEIENNQP